MKKHDKPSKAYKKVKMKATIAKIKKFRPKIFIDYETRI